MSGIIFDSCVRALRFSRLTGPIFDKELRVSSRRRRSYLLRWAYVTAFMLLLTLIWLEEVPRGSSSVYQASRMAQAGQSIIMFVVWFQFLAAQGLAVVMLSAAISDEIHHRTLGLLMTTPIGSLQIIFGKLLSKLLQVTLLLAISLPMLAIVRLFGGIPWDFLICGLCVTLTTTIFYGSLSLFFSIFTRRAYVVIVRTILAGGVLFALLPLLVVLLFRRVVSERTIVSVLAYFSPYLGLINASDGLVSGARVRWAAWPVHCGIALGCSALILLLAAVLVRKAALRQATGQAGLLSGRRKIETADGMSRGYVRRVIGPPVLWKERRSPLLGRWTIGRAIAAVAVAGLLLLTYILSAHAHALRAQGSHIAYILVYAGLGMLVTAILPATCITTEKESQTWPILLTTTVSNGGIIWGKLLGAVRRCLPGWGLLFGHVIVFALLGYIHPVAILQLGILVGWISMFLCATGLYFSMRFKRTTTAVIANVALAAGIWAVIPALLGLTVVATHSDGDLLGPYMDMNPAVHTVVIAIATCNKGQLARYEWIQGGLRSVGATIAWMVFNFVVYVGIGAAFLWRAWSHVRRKPV
jgi:ABC-2 type transport system permease protein